MCFYFVYGLKPFIIKKFFNDKSDRAKSGYNTENVISNCNNFSLIINVICDCCDGLVGSPILAVFLLYVSFNLSSWFQYFTELMISFWKRLLSIMIEYIFSIPKEFSSGNPLYCLRDNWRSIILKSSAFSIHIYI